MSDTATEIQQELSRGQRRRRPRHYVELDARGRPTDQALCGYLWDQLHVPNDPEAGVCQACVDELRRRGHG